MHNYLLFIDESGTSSLKNVDPNFPILVLTGLLISKSNYEDMVKEVNKLKKKYFPDKQVVLHRRDMRKYERGFEIFFDDKVKKSFYIDLNRILTKSDYMLISTGIDKEKYIREYGKLANDPYRIALSFMLERTVMETDSRAAVTIDVFIESRGKKEDRTVAERFNQLLYSGSSQIASARFLQRFSKKLNIHKKEDGVIGIEMADLCVYPIAKHLLNNNEPNPAFDVILPKIRNRKGQIEGYGIKILP